MTAEPPFVVCGPSGALIADGVLAGYRDVADAQSALRSGEASIVMGALPFDVDGPTALMAPRSVQRVAALPDWPTGPMPAVRVSGMLPAPEEHRARVRRACDELAAADSPLQKVVLARALRLTADAPLDARILLRRLVDNDPAAYGYLVDLSAAGGDYAGRALVGASPELLVARDGDRVTCQPFAGSAPRHADPDLDAAAGAALAESAKDRHEHQLVIDTMAAALRPLCSELTTAAEPALSRTAALWHLSTPVVGTLRDTSTTAMDLALAVHPTPAVGGVPTEAAVELIGELEGDRGFYAGAVGWCDANGDGRWVVTLRGAQLAADRRGALAHAGGGIVAESDPDGEVAETTTKFITILTALGVRP
ncbi:isochorismate synthase [Candidatus Mycobacterium wuenschmannii]|uniref:isochorismate synthase n=1 Tax=Candidatus Mycobacterium wuenschmannii TaxID=3027808 RepID=A0ABY8VXY2_9MYCO|nr:isochorismate synthase [Candidatus Mycobacterium wuenschmannii]WIM87865.1 isochorismate synthase [Candidatus Mycobacterium wuenschmannii]